MPCRRHLGGWFVNTADLLRCKGVLLAKLDELSATQVCHGQLSSRRIDSIF